MCSLCFSILCVSLSLTRSPLRRSIFVSSTDSEEQKETVRSQVCARLVAVLALVILICYLSFIVRVQKLK